MDETIRMRLHSIHQGPDGLARLRQKDRYRYRHTMLKCAVALRKSGKSWEETTEALRKEGFTNEFGGLLSRDGLAHTTLKYYPEARSK